MLSFESAFFSCCFKFLITVFEDFLLLVFQSVFGGHIADGAVQPDCVVVFDELRHELADLFQVQGRFDPDAIAYASSSLSRTAHRAKESEHGGDDSSYEHPDGFVRRGTGEEPGNIGAERFHSDHSDDD